MGSSPSSQSVIKSKRAQRDNIIASAQSYTENKEKFNEYLKATASEIVKHIEGGQWTASDVVEAYIARAAYAHATTNCLTEVLFDQARARAVVLDKEFQATGKLVGPLHGVPVSFKDQYQIAGYDSTLGYTRWADKPSTDDSPVVAKFRAAGAIIVAKGNVPQTLLAYECSNPLWGRTLNPYNAAYTSGGSSGGDAALLAMDGSTLAFGTDNGGSLRTPASFCGVYSLKPTAGRITSDGCTMPNPGFQAIQLTVGPMSRSVDDIELACKLTFGLTDVAQSNPPLPWRDITLPSKLRFGFYASDGFVKASPACQRAVLETIDALRKEGHECIEIAPDIGKSLIIFCALLSADGYKDLLSPIGPDPKESTLFLPTLGPKLPAFIRNLTVWLARQLGENVTADVQSVSCHKSAFEYHQWIANKAEVSRAFYKEVWVKHALDGIIAPVQPLPCVQHGATALLSPLSSGTLHYNVVECSSGVVPITRVDPEKDKLTDEWRSSPGHGSKLLEKEMYEGKHPAYDPENMAGLPIGVQVVGKAWEDEKVIGMMRVIDNALGDRGFGPGCWSNQVKA